MRCRTAYEHASWNCRREKAGVQIETETLSNRSKLKRSRNKKLGPAWALGPEDRSDIETKTPNHVEIESIEPRPSLPFLTASSWGQEKRGHHRGATIPHNQLSWTSVTKYDNLWQRVRTQNEPWQHAGDCGPSVNTPSVPTLSGGRRLLAGEERRESWPKTASGRRMFTPGASCREAFFGGGRAHTGVCEQKTLLRRVRPLGR